MVRQSLGLTTSPNFSPINGAANSKGIRVIDEPHRRGLTILHQFQHLKRPLDHHAMANGQAVTTIDLTQYGLKKIASGKVRELYEIDADTLLFVATDRISAFDVILDNGVPQKGELLTQLSAHWFGLIKTWLPELRTHLITTDLPSNIPADARSQLERRCSQVHRFEIVPLESIVRGYITGSAWAEYKSKGTVHGMEMPKGLQESQRLDVPIWTPSTKAEQGEHDENISKAKATELVGVNIAQQVEEVSLKLYIKVRCD